MNTENAIGWLELAEKHGPWMIFALFGVFAVVYLGKWILKHLLEQLKEERESRKGNDEAHLKTLERHTNTLVLLSETNREAHAYQKTEHETMINVLKSMQDQQEKFQDRLFDKLDK